MTTTPEQALQIIEAFIRTERPDWFVKGLLEDSDDYLAVVGTRLPMWSVGESLLLVAKDTGELWEAAPGEGIEKSRGMTPVRVTPG